MRLENKNQMEDSIFYIFTLMLSQLSFRPETRSPGQIAGTGHLCVKVEYGPSGVEK